jgi:hypothetical protein
MFELQGNALLFSVSLLTSLGFLLIGYDNVSLHTRRTKTTSFDDSLRVDCVC